MNDLAKIEREILEFLALEGPVDTKTVVEEAGGSFYIVRPLLDKLAKEGKISRQKGRRTQILWDAANVPIAARVARLEHFYEYLYQEMRSVKEHEGLKVLAALQDLFANGARSND